MTLGRYIAIGLALTAALAGVFFFLNSRNIPRLEGSILQVRNVATDSRANVVLLDVRIANPGRTLFMVREASVLIQTASGELLEAPAAPEPDIDRLLGYYKLLGPRYNPTLKARQRLEPGSKADFTIAGAFSLTEEEFAARRSLRVRITDVDGAVVDLGPPAR